MQTALTHEAIAAYLAVVVSLAALLVSIIAARLARTTNESQKNIARRQGVIELHEAWQGVNEIDPQALIGPDVNKAVNALNLTATLWNHDVIAKDILFQSYWEPFNELYSALAHNHSRVPGYERQARAFITQPIHRCHEEMMQMANASIRQTTM